MWASLFPVCLMKICMLQTCLCVFFGAHRLKSILILRDWTSLHSMWTNSTATWKKPINHIEFRFSVRYTRFKTEEKSQMTSNFYADEISFATAWKNPLAYMFRVHSALSWDEFCNLFILSPALIQRRCTAHTRSHQPKVTHSIFDTTLIASSLCDEGRPIYTNYFEHKLKTRHPSNTCFSCNFCPDVHCRSMNVLTGLSLLILLTKCIRLLF